MCSSVAVSLLTSCPENTSAWVCTLFMLIPWLFFLSNPWPSFCSQLNPFLHQFYLLPFFSLTSLLHPVSCPSWALPHLSLHTCPMRALASPHSPQFAIQFPRIWIFSFLPGITPGRPRFQTTAFPLCLLLRMVCLISCARSRGMSLSPVLCSP